MKDIPLTITVGFLILISIITQMSIASFVFPDYYIFIFVSIILFFVFSKIDFEILEAFSGYFYVGSIIFLIIPLLIGQVTRGAVRWIPIGSLTIQPAEFVRPFIILFLASYLTKTAKIDMKRFAKACFMFAVPLSLILLQPSLGVSVLLSLGFLGVILAIGFDKRMLLVAILFGVVLAPFSWFVMAPYQKLRVKSLFLPEVDPYGAGYNSIQSKISVGSGGIFGRGIGEGIQTQLSFLPERHTDFIFASIAEELGMVGAGLLLFVLFFLLYRVISTAERAINPTARAFVAGIFLTLFAQTVVHIGMNMGLFPITGIPLPLVSIGGSSLLATMMMLGMVVAARK